MSSRIDIQLTSRLADDQWSWRAAGAREPRGTVSSSLIPDGAKEGDVLRAEIERSLEGIEILALSVPPTTQEHPAKVEKIELLGSGRQQAGVSWSLAPKSKGRPRRDGKEGGGDGPRGERRERSGGPGPSRGGPRSGRPSGAPRSESRGRPAAPAQSTEHRNTLLATLETAQLPIAEQLLRGGIPSVRQAIDEQNAQAKAEGRPPASADAIMAIAEGLLPLTTLAAWKDRASTALAGGKETRLRDLRAIVTASRSVSLDEEGRAMAKTLHESLDHRVKGMSDEWVTRISAALDEGKIAEAFRIASRAPDHATRLPSDLAARLATEASAALTPETDPRDWMALLDAVVESPVRRTVKPVGIPPEPDVESAARNAAGLVPALATLLGLRIPPPPPRRVIHR